MSDYRKFGNFIDITQCKECSEIGPRDTIRWHPADPCHLCGGERVEKVGRFCYSARPWWKFWWKLGRWEIKRSKY
jgi:hypothetical protein